MQFTAARAGAAVEPQLGSPGIEPGRTVEKHRRGRCEELRRLQPGHEPPKDAALHRRFGSVVAPTPNTAAERNFKLYARPRKQSQATGIDLGSRSATGSARDTVSAVKRTLRYSEGYAVGRKIQNIRRQHKGVLIAPRKHDGAGIGKVHSRCHRAHSSNTGSSRSGAIGTTSLRAASTTCASMFINTSGCYRRHEELCF